MKWYQRQPQRQCGVEPFLLPKLQERQFARLALGCFTYLVNTFRQFLLAFCSYHHHQGGGEQPLILLIHRLLQITNFFHTVDDPLGQVIFGVHICFQRPPAGVLAFHRQPRPIRSHQLFAFYLVDRLYHERDREIGLYLRKSGEQRVCHPGWVVPHHQYLVVQLTFVAHQYQA